MLPFPQLCSYPYLPFTCCPPFPAKGPRLSSTTQIATNTRPPGFASKLFLPGNKSNPNYTMADYSNLPDFDSLPPVEDMPQGCAWGIFDKDGKKDHLGCLNLLTPKVVQEAYKEARDGVSISLNWPIGALRSPFFGRKGIRHKVISYQGAGLHAIDDEIEFNTQCSSQWDSLVHYAHQPTGRNYNGVSPAAEDLVQHFGHHDTEQVFPTLNHWHSRGRQGNSVRLLLSTRHPRAHARGHRHLVRHALQARRHPAREDGLHG